MFLSSQLYREAIKNVLMLICKFMLSEVHLNKYKSLWGTCTGSSIKWVEKTEYSKETRLLSTQYVHSFQVKQSDVSLHILKLG